VNYQLINIRKFADFNHVSIIKFQHKNELQLLFKIIVLNHLIIKHKLLSFVLIIIGIIIIIHFIEFI